jgi:hypothetical protein
MAETMEPLLYLARCPHCGCVVAAMTPRAMQDHPKEAARWLRDGLGIERSETAAGLAAHKEGCLWALPSPSR